MVALDDFKLKCWGARGTGPTPSGDKLEVGGNTSCLAARVGEREHLILDGGSGLRLLGRELTARRGTDTARYHIFLSHYHFDHIEGLPLFPPLYDARSVITFYGFEPEGRSMREVLEAYISPPYFPVSLANVPSKVDFVDVDAGPHRIGPVAVEALPVNHPDGCRSLRLDRGNRRIVYATDHEHGIDAIDEALVEFARGADYLIHDATYQPAEYEQLRKGWGHSTWYAAVQTTLRADVGNLILFHHHPDHTDKELARVLEVSRKEFPATRLAVEGMELPF